MKPLLIFLFTLVFFSSIKESLAQRKEVSTGNQQWFQYYNQIKLDEKWALLTDGGLRTRNNFDEFSQYLIRTGIGFNPSSILSFLVGFAHLGFYNNGSRTRSELRPYQELVINNKLAPISLSHRYRVEERFFRNTSQDNSKSNSFNFRFRYRIMASIPLWESTEHDGKSLSFNVGDEILINAGKDVVYNVFNQNRILIGPAFQLNKTLDFSLTYTHQFSASNAPREYQNSHIFWLGIKHKMDFTSKK
ncbi:DUF2490 domain-containing protein [Echinicola jeungdonensis]|uniref:DUF2490 domain-containing protein n=1 Tax=Echinicola jeungdonensis TaxID=709343 RepID=A0ABV5J6S7_9BACT|nr:DUF2490 domain-containing protein [Echinicola jeungdonensis]MDN3669814.1 DUF2490 domain-containing protein [Echinicola jeungdonensis]